MLDLAILFAVRGIRMFSYGGITIIFMTSLLARYSAGEVNLLLTGILLGDLVISLILTTRADRTIGRRRVLAVGALLKILCGIAFAFTSSFYALLFAGTLGVISPTGGDIGPFLSVEQASLTEVCMDSNGTISNAALTSLLAWFQLLASVCVAAGGLAAGWYVDYLMDVRQASSIDAYRAIYLAYATMGVAELVLYLLLSDKVEVQESQSTRGGEGDEGEHPIESSTGLTRKSRLTIAKLCGLFSVDSFASGLILQSFVAWWFATKWLLSEQQLGETFVIVNLAAGISGLAAGWFVRKIGAINTMVFTHLPSNILLVMIPFMPTREAAVAMLWARFAICEMDVPARQAYVAVVVRSSERSAASGWTNSADSVGFALAPLALTLLAAETSPTDSWAFASPFVIAGALKVGYDLTLYFLFATTRHVGRADETTTEQEIQPLTQVITSNAKEGPSTYDTFHQ